MKLKGVLLDADSLGEKIDFSGLEQQLDAFDVYEQTTPQQLMARIQDADIILSNKVVLDEAAIRSCSSLKLICVLATGMNNIDLETAAELNIPVKNAIAYGTNSVAQHTLMLMLMLTTQQVRYSKAIMDGQWQQSPFFCMMQHSVSELAGKHLVIVGSGILGSKVAQLAEAFEMKVSFSARPGQEESDNRPALTKLLPEADMLSLHCPLTTETQDLINQATLALAKPCL